MLKPSSEQYCVEPWVWGEFKQPVWRSAARDLEGHGLLDASQ